MRALRLVGLSRAAVLRQMKEKLAQWRWFAAALIPLAVIAYLASRSGAPPQSYAPDEVEANAPPPQPSSDDLTAIVSNPSVTRVEIEKAKVVTSEDGSAPFADELSRARVVAGLVTRDEVGPNYDSLIYGLARERLVEFSSEEYESTIAKFCGFDDWAALQAAIGEAETDAAKHNAMIDLLDEAAVVTGELEQRLADSWTDGYRLEVFDPEGAHDSKAWIATRGLSGDKGNLRMSRAARVGDRQFCIHFNSVDYPGLDFAVSRIRERAKSYSERWR
jgi:hypothetical protein